VKGWKERDEVTEGKRRRDRRREMKRCNERDVER
jgi:hypothetical protein